MTTSDKAWIQLMIHDRVVHNLSESLIKLATAMHQNKDIDLHTGSEGPCLDSLTYRSRDHLMTLLQSLCDEMQYDPGRILIHTGNPIETVKSKFKIHRVNTAEGWFYGDYLSKIIIDHNKKFTHHFGNFVSNSTYPRLLLASYLHKNHGHKTWQTYRRDPCNPGQAVDLDLDKLMFECADRDVLQQVAEFVKHLPIDLEPDLPEHPGVDNDIEGRGNGAMGETILSWYNKFFCDIVNETFFTGHTFFPTEKTTRPLLSMNPFVVHGPIHYLKRLRYLGFKTFSNFWNEDYDNLQGYARCKSIYKVIDYIAGQDINNMYEEMKPILEHNRKTLLELDSNKYGSLLARY